VPSGVADHSFRSLVLTPKLASARHPGQLCQPSFLADILRLAFQDLDFVGGVLLIVKHLEDLVGPIGYDVSLQQMGHFQYVVWPEALIKS